MIYGYVRKSNEEGVDSSFETQRYKINSYCNLKYSIINNILGMYIMEKNYYNMNFQLKTYNTS